MIYEEQKQHYECVQGTEGGYCYSWGEAIMMLPCEGKAIGLRLFGSGEPSTSVQSSNSGFSLLPIYFPPSNARLDERFSMYMEFLSEAWRKSKLISRGGLSGAGGIVLDAKDHAVFFDISAPTGKKIKMQTWRIQIVGYGSVLMDMEMRGEEIEVHYMRTMTDGSYTESNYSYSSDAKCPRPVILDPSHTPKE